MYHVFIFSFFLLEIWGISFSINARRNSPPKQLQHNADDSYSIHFISNSARQVQFVFLDFFFRTRAVHSFLCDRHAPFWHCALQYFAPFRWQGQGYSKQMRCGDVTLFCKSSRSITLVDSDSTSVPSSLPQCPHRSPAKFSLTGSLYCFVNLWTSRWTLAFQSAQDVIRLIFVEPMNRAYSPRDDRTFQMNSFRFLISDFDRFIVTSIGHVFRRCSIYATI